MAYYQREIAPNVPPLSPRRPLINEYFLSAYTMSIYAGCEFGCPYCDSWVYHERPLNETIAIPVDLPQRLAAVLPTIDRGDLIAISALSDPYQPAEETYRITRQVLQLFAEHRQPCLVMTKSPLVLEDRSLLQKINEQSLAIVVTTLLTLDQHLATRIEARAPSPQLRLELITELKRAGIPVGVALVPIMPYVNDSNLNLRRVLHACATAGADFVIWDYLHIPNERHRHRINVLLNRLGSYPPRYYRDIYRDQATVNPLYRYDRDYELLQRCDELGLAPRAPHHLFAGKLSPRNEAALLLRHTAFRDRVQGRDRLATLHRELADAVYRGRIRAADLRQSPLYPTIGPLLGLSATG
ncbi:SPL family radical SAM protein [Chloroflexus aggregans]|uniref:Radical SAM domain protein n=1 Tax=Chloroflexus aggregans (strain MD-66 / DSM 9485) TaxID=326427 RepID=B8GAG9_CHLAD|nr:radical SAM protein [Chloroflexus aggregans]ACL26544.1 Radical SAM domain protein [Chloroflexus aggregans DSM 9485]